MIFQKITRKRAQQTDKPKMYVVKVTIDGETRSFGLTASNENELHTQILAKFGVVDAMYHDMDIEFLRIGLTTNSHAVTF